MTRKTSLTKIILIFLISLFCLSFASDSVVNTYHMDSAMVIPTKDSYLSIRKGPGFTYPILFTLDSVSALTVVEKGIWYKVLYNDTYGYVHSRTFIDEKAYEPDRLKAYTIGINPDGQVSLNKGLEFLSPLSKTMVEKMTERHQGLNSQLYDYEINLTLANRLKKALEDEGATVIMTKIDAASSLSNLERARFVNRNECDIVITISCESSDNPAESGIQVYVSKHSTNKLAMTLAQNILQTLNSTFNLDKSDVKVANDITFLNWAEGEAILIELGFLSNREDEKRITSQDSQQSYVKAIKDSIVSTLIDGD